MKREHFKRYRSTAVLSLASLLLLTTACGENPHLIRKKNSGALNPSEEPGAAGEETATNAGGSDTAQPSTPETAWGGGEEAHDTAAAAESAHESNAAAAGFSAGNDNNIANSESAIPPISETLVEPPSTIPPISETLVEPPSTIPPNTTTPLDSSTPPDTFVSIVTLETESFLSEMDAEPVSERDLGEVSPLFLNMASGAKSTRQYSAPPLRSAKGIGYAKGSNILFRFLLDLPPRENVKAIRDFRIGFKNLRRVVDATDLPTDAIKLKGQVLASWTPRSAPATLLPNRPPTSILPSDRSDPNRDFRVFGLRLGHLVETLSDGSNPRLGKRAISGRDAFWNTRRETPRLLVRECSADGGLRVAQNPIRSCKPDLV